MGTDPSADPGAKTEDWAEVADWHKRHPDGLLILDSLPPGVSSEFPELGVWRGFNYSKGESVTVRLMASESGG